ncbi:hypothetical protein CRX72_22345 [Pantoea sp. BRM17]|nr:hypothetical protein CRX72_22345 [Pantoea sp. BRM17]
MKSLPVLSPLSEQAIDFPPGTAGTLSWRAINDYGGITDVRTAHTGAALPADRESLYWLSIKSVPGTPKEETNRLLITVKSVFKLFYRPAGLPGDAATAFEKITFRRQGIGGSRLIYEGNARQAALSISNPDDYPYLIQAWVDKDPTQRHSDNTFIATPPLFRLEPHTQNSVRIVFSSPNMCQLLPPLAQVRRMRLPRLPLPITDNASRLRLLLFREDFMIRFCILLIVLINPLMSLAGVE